MDTKAFKRREVGPCLRGTPAGRHEDTKFFGCRTIKKGIAPGGAMPRIMEIVLLGCSDGLVQVIHCFSNSHTGKFHRSADFSQESSFHFACLVGSETYAI